MDPRTSSPVLSSHTRLEALVPLLSDTVATVCPYYLLQMFVDLLDFIYIYIHTYNTYNRQQRGIKAFNIQGVTGGRDKTSEGCSLC
jgi:hypothetical protein